MIKDYRGIYLRCVAEGYDAGKEYMKSVKVTSYPEPLICPYDRMLQSYEYNAWWQGHDWYTVRVH